MWSNCLAGWWLGGGGNTGSLPLLILGITVLYLGGMFLNDAFDAEFDRQHRPERPIPSGKISSALVWRLGFGMLLFGNGLLCFLGVKAGILGGLLALTILFYDAVHKSLACSPLIMGLCRCLVYPCAAAVGAQGVNGYAIWGGLALGAYVVGLSFVARRESFRGRPPSWPLALVAVPVLWAMVVNSGIYREAAALVALVLTIWVLLAIRPTYFAASPNVGRSVSRLLAGIVLVDWLAVAYLPREVGVVFVGLLVLAIFTQRYAPAT